MLIEVDILWILKCTLYAIMQFMFMSFVFKLFFCYGRTKKENILDLSWSGIWVGDGSMEASTFFFSFFSAGSNTGSIPMLKTYDMEAWRKKSWPAGTGKPGKPGKRHHKLAKAKSCMPFFITK